MSSSQQEQASLLRKDWETRLDLGLEYRKNYIEQRKKLEDVYEEEIRLRDSEFASVVSDFEAEINELRNRNTILENELKNFKTTQDGGDVGGHGIGIVSGGSYIIDKNSFELSSSSEQQRRNSILEAKIVKLQTRNEFLEKELNDFYTDQHDEKNNRCIRTRPSSVERTRSALANANTNIRRDSSTDPRARELKKLQRDLEHQQKEMQRQAREINELSNAVHVRETNLMALKKEQVQAKRDLDYERKERQRYQFLVQKAEMKTEVKGENQKAEVTTTSRNGMSSVTAVSPSSKKYSNSMKSHDIILQPHYHDEAHISSYAGGGRSVSPSNVSHQNHSGSNIHSVGSNSRLPIRFGFQGEASKAVGQGGGPRSRSFSPIVDEQSSNRNAQSYNKSGQMYSQNPMTGSVIRHHSDGVTNSLNQKQIGNARNLTTFGPPPGRTRVGNSSSVSTSVNSSTIVGTSNSGGWITSLSQQQNRSGMNSPPALSSSMNNTNGRCNTNITSNHNSVDASKRISSRPNSAREISNNTRGKMTNHQTGNIKLQRSNSGEKEFGSAENSNIGNHSSRSHQIHPSSSQQIQPPSSQQQHNFHPASRRSASPSLQSSRNIIRPVSPSLQSSRNFHRPGSPGLINPGQSFQEEMSQQEQHNINMDNGWNGSSQLEKTQQQRNVGTMNTNPVPMNTNQSGMNTSVQKQRIGPTRAEQTASCQRLHSGGSAYLPAKNKTGAAVKITYKSGTNQQNGCRGNVTQAVEDLAEAFTEAQALASRFEDRAGNSISASSHKTRERQARKDMQNQLIDQNNHVRHLPSMGGILSVPCSTNEGQSETQFYQQERDNAYRSGDRNNRTVRTTNDH